MWRLLLGTMGVKSLVQGLNAAATAGFEPRTVWSEVRRRNRLATAPPVEHSSLESPCYLALVQSSSPVYNCFSALWRVIRLHLFCKPHRHVALSLIFPAFTPVSALHCQWVPNGPKQSALSAVSKVNDEINFFMLVLFLQRSFHHRQVPGYQRAQP